MVKAGKLPFFEHSLQDAAQWIRERQKFVLCTHMHPDADGVGSEVALYHALTALGKDVIIFNPTPVPRHLRFLCRNLDLPWAKTEQDCAEGLQGRHPILLDIGTLDRLGLIFRLLKESGEDCLVIDHHPALAKGPVNCGRSVAKLVNQEVSSTGELCHGVLRHLGSTLTKPIARALYAAIATDTGFFKHSNASANTFRIAAELIDCGVRPDRIFKELYERNSFPKVLLAGKIISTMQLGEFGKVAWVRMTKKMLRESHATMEDTSEIVNYTLRVSGVEVGILLKEIDSKHTKLSVRSKGQFPANRIAQLWNGGGHAKAAGAMVPLPLDEAERQVVSRVQDMLGLLGPKVSVGGL